MPPVKKPPKGSSSALIKSRRGKACRTSLPAVSTTAQGVEAAHEPGNSGNNQMCVQFQITSPRFTNLRSRPPGRRRWFHAFPGLPRSEAAWQARASAPCVTPSVLSDGQYARLHCLDAGKRQPADSHTDLPIDNVRFATVRFDWWRHRWVHATPSNYSGSGAPVHLDGHPGQASPRYRPVIRPARYASRKMVACIGRGSTRAACVFRWRTIACAM
jgi:hypothetical protein